MISLFWKDIRHNLPVVVTALILPFLPTAIALVVYLFSGRGLGESANDFELGLPFAYFLAVFSFWLLGSCVISSERQDYTCEFLACLPVSRWKVVGSKLLLIASLFILIFSALSILTMLNPGSSTVNGVPTSAAVIVGFYLPVGIVVAGTGWLLSTFIRSVLTTTFGALMLTVLAFIVGDYLFRVPLTQGQVQPEVLLIFIGLVGLSLFIAGALYYARRPTP